MRSSYSVEAVAKTKGGLPACNATSSRALRGRQHIQALCRAQQDDAQNMGRKMVAIAAGAALLLQSGPSLADVSNAAEASNATVEASASVNAVTQEQNQTLQRSDDQRQVQKKAPSSAQTRQ